MTCRLFRWMFLGAVVAFVLSWLPLEADAFELVVRVQKPDGAPAAGVKVQQVLLVHNDSDNDVAGATDEKGELRIALEGVKTVIDGTGYGEYRFLAMPDGYRWEMSPKYFWTYPPQAYETASPELRRQFDEAKKLPGVPSRNSDIGEEIWATPDVPIIWNVALTPGNDVTVHVKDQSDAPVPNTAIEMVVDLCVPSHTGWGGEVELPEVKTDENGRFVIRHAGDFFYTFTPRTKQYCSPTLGWYHYSVEARFVGKEGVLTLHKLTPKRLCVKAIDKDTRAPVEGAYLWLGDKDGGRLVTPEFGRTNRDGVFETEEFLYSDIAAMVIVDTCDGGSSTDGQDYEASSINMDGFDPVKDYVLELTPVAR